ncbi:calcium-binding protein [Nocardioides humilatus]|nr:calcium-binding protein [Nocardioides humilatus]
MSGVLARLTVPLATVAWLVAAPPAAYSSGAMTIPDHGPASAYPSTWSVAAPAGMAVTDVDLHFDDLTHDYVMDLDVMLVAPDGTAAVVMSDISEAQGPVNAVDIVLDDEAVDPLPANDPLTSGAWQPLNVDDVIVDDEFAAPAPDPDGLPSALSTFDGIDPSGDWHLYVVDDWGGNAGRIGGWSLDVSYATTATCLGVPATIVGSGDIDGTAGADVIVGSSGDDMIDAFGGADLICSGDGDDYIVSGAGNDYIEAGDGEDDIVDGPGMDASYGGADDDVLTQGSSGDIGDTLDGGPGHDGISYASRTSDVTIDLGDGLPNDGYAGEHDQVFGIEAVSTGPGDDTIVGSSGDDGVSAGAGDNTVTTGAGDDHVTTLDGDNVIDTGAGDDSVFPGAGADQVTTGTGADLVDTGAGNDILDTGSGDDIVTDTAGKDTISLGIGDDYLRTGAAKDNGDRYDGGSGADTASYLARTAAVKLSIGNSNADDGSGAEGDRLLAFEGATGGSGADTITGSSGADELDGGPGNDTITDGGGADDVHGRDGNDLLVQGSSSDAGDRLDGGAGTDEVRYNARTTAVTITLSSGADDGGAGEDDQVVGVENARGGSVGDTITGTEGANVLYGGDGNNVIRGSSGDDTIYGGTGNDWIEDGRGADKVEAAKGDDLIFQPGAIDPGDVLNGGSGAEDWLIYDQRDTEVTIKLSGTASTNGAPGEADKTSGFENAIGGAGDDSISGTGSRNHVLGNGGDDEILGLGGEDSLYGDDGGLVFFGTDHGTDGDDNIYGGDGEGWLWGGGGDDFLVGGGASDVINAGDGDDRLSGSGGSDYLYSVDHVAGNDSVDGGSGNADEAVIDEGDPTERAETVFWG